jgi:ABC-type multidrug transport system ATPase subunit
LLRLVAGEVRPTSGVIRLHGADVGGLTPGRTRGGAVIAVLHDLNLAARYCDQIAVLRSGQLLAMGTVEAVIRDVTLSTAYGLSVRVDRIPETAGPCVLPRRAALSNAEFARDENA